MRKTSMYDVAKMNEWTDSEWSEFLKSEILKEAEDILQEVSADPKLQEMNLPEDFDEKFRKRLLQEHPELTEEKDSCE